MIIIMKIIMIIIMTLEQVLTVKKADRAADTGLYRIRLTCEGGRSSSSLYLLVSSSLYLSVSSSSLSGLLILVMLFSTT